MLSTDGRFEIRVTRDQADVEAAQRLRYHVFYEEMSADPTPEMRAVRRLMLRHPPNNNQRTTALFLSLGHYDSLVHKLHKAYRARWEALSSALDKHLPGMSQVPSFGGTSFWVTGPKSLDTEKLAERALEEGVVIEPGHVCFAQNPPPKNVFRLGFSSIALERIEPGIEILARLIQR